MPDSPDSSHNGQTIPELFQLVAECENRSRLNKALNEWADYLVAHGPVKLSVTPPEDDEQDEPYCCPDCEAAKAEDFSDPVHDRFRA